MVVKELTDLNTWEMSRRDPEALAISVTSVPSLKLGSSESSVGFSGQLTLVRKLEFIPHNMAQAVHTAATDAENVETDTFSLKIRRVGAILVTFCRVTGPDRSIM